MRTFVVTVGLGILLGMVCGAPPAVAKSEPKGEPCRAELDKFCKDVATGEGRVLKCMQEHGADLSEECRAYVNTASLYTACLDDVMRFCPRIQPGGARGIQCLRTHQSDLSTPCKNELRRHQH